MGLFNKHKNEDILPSVISFRFDDDMLAYRYREKNFVVGSQLIVNPGQVAIFIKDGSICDIFGSGQYEINSDTLPILNRKFGMLFKQGTLFQTSIVFFNIEKEVELFWGTSSPITVVDSATKFMTKAKANGSLTINIEDPQKFLLRILGQLDFVNVKNLDNFIHQKAVETITTIIAEVLKVNQVSLLDITLHYSSISEETLKRLITKRVFSDYGLRVCNFSIRTIKMPDEDYERLSEMNNKYLEEIKEVDALRYRGDIYDKEMKYDVLKTAAQNQAQGAFMNPMMGLGMGFGMANMMNDMTGRMNAESNTPQVRQILCQSCGKQISENVNFCPYCSAKNSANDCCPKCGKSILKGAMFCGFCGTKLNEVIKCKKCQGEIPSGSKFCPSCGEGVE